MSNKILKESERNPASTVYVGNLDEEADEELLYELGIQAGPVINVYIPIDRVNGKNSGFGFLEYRTEKDAEYAADILNGIMLFGKPLRINKSSQEKVKMVDIGAEVFIGNLDPLVDEKTLYDTFSVFGKLLRVPNVARDEQGVSRGFGFVSFGDFESSDKAIESMNDQYLMNKQIHLSYAFKKEGKGERHGDEAERLLAAEAKKHNYTMLSGERIPWIEGRGGVGEAGEGAGGDGDGDGRKPPRIRGKKKGKNEEEDEVEGYGGYKGRIPTEPRNFN